MGSKNENSLVGWEGNFHWLLRSDCWVTARRGVTILLRLGPWLSRDRQSSLGGADALADDPELGAFIGLLSRYLLVCSP